MFWHETVHAPAALGRYSADRKTKRLVRRSAEIPELFEAYYERRPTVARVPPEERIQLRPRIPIRAATAQEAVTQADTLLEIAASGRQDELFEKRPCPLPKPEVARIESPTHYAIAVVYFDTPTRYEIRYFGDFLNSTETGWRLCVPDLPDDAELPLGFERRSYADSPDAARQFAVVELERIARTKENLAPRSSIE